MRGPLAAGLSRWTWRVLLPWIVYLAYSLPSRQLSADYDVAWAGFDVMLLVALASTGYFAFPRSRYLATAGARRR